MQTTTQKAAGRVTAIDKCIAWQEYVLRNSTDPKQKARCQAAVERLKQERQQIACVTA